MTQISSVYGQALYDLAKSEDLSETILQQITVLAQSFAMEPDFLRLLCAPNISKQERCAIADKSFREHVHPYVLNFIKILTEKGYIRRFGDCCAEYEAQYNRDNGILSVQAVTACALTAEQSQRLTDKLSNLTGKTIRLQNTVDPKCLGGIRLNYDGKQVDDTVAHRLDSIRTMLKTTVL